MASTPITIAGRGRECRPGSGRLALALRLGGGVLVRLLGDRGLLSSSFALARPDAVLRRLWGGGRGLLGDRLGLLGDGLRHRLRGYGRRRDRLAARLGHRRLRPIGVQGVERVEQRERPGAGGLGALQVVARGTGVLRRLLAEQVVRDLAALRGVDPAGGAGGQLG
jgi:hypothetical protein